MPTCSGKKSSVPLHLNSWENCEHDRGYDGYYRFDKEQEFEGEFFRDSIHGQGTYKWKDLAVYEGGFYSNFKEGYASLSFSDCSYFEGLFIKNQPFGPGILTHANGRQDAGFWVGRKLVRLSRAVDFIIPRLAPTSAAKIKLLQFRRLIPLNEDDSESAANFLKKYGLAENCFTPFSSLIYDPRSMFFEKQVFEKAYFIHVKELSKALMSSPTDWENAIRQSGDFEERVEEEEEEKDPNKIPSHCLCPQELFEMEYKTVGETDICDMESTGGEYEMGILAYFSKYGTLEELDNKEEEEKSNSIALSGNPCVEEEVEEGKKDKSKPKIVSWNRSELCTEMLKQIFRYRAFEASRSLRGRQEALTEKLNFNLAKLMLGVRTAFRRTGEKEKQCIQFLKMCSIGPVHVVKDMLCSYEISEELMDARGNNSLMFAAATDQHDIIDVLLDYGVDVNTFNDESLTPLNLCLLRRLAQTYEIYNWETAFLPEEISATIVSDNYTQAEDLQSIPSLDRIFGDGMSMSDSKSFLLDPRLLSPFPSQSVTNETNEISVHLEEYKEFSDISQITLCKISKSQGSYSLFLPNLDDRIPGQKSTSTCFFQKSAELIQPLGSSERTPKINIKIIPNSIKRDEFQKSIQKSITDKYLFEFSFEKKPELNQGKEVSGKASKAKTSKAQKEEPKVTEPVEEKKELNLELMKKLEDIDKTIEKLLKRGANPNISEVPKPSIHLGVYTKNIKTVYTLLLHGASPNCQLYSNEGLLTPLHVIVLQKPAEEYVEICELLLKFDANPEEETVPEFFICEEEKEFLVSEHGRTPLQLLCMRPDLEYADPNESLIKIGLMLAKVSDKRHFYNGHSCLTLAMHFGNLKLFKALLDSRFFDPNDILGEDRGTSLHVLVSTELQMKTDYDRSIKMCDLLIAGGADPLKKFKSPEKLLGTCVDYGYREIESGKDKRKISTAGKKSEKAPKEKPKKEKAGTRDYLKDQERVVEYLNGIAMEMAKSKVSKKSGGRGDKTQESKSQDSFKKRTGTSQKFSKREDEKTLKDDKSKEENKEKQASDGKEKTKKSENSDNAKKSKNKNDSNESEEDKNFKKLEGDLEKKDVKGGRKKKDEDADGKKDQEKTKRTDKNKEKETKKEAKCNEKDKEKGHGKKSREKENLKTDLNLGKAIKGSTKNLYLKIGTRSETFPEKLRQTLLLIYGTCSNVDINEFLVPYVVLRNGQLYYRFHGNTDKKEQYSLI